MANPKDGLKSPASVAEIKSKFASATKNARVDASPLAGKMTEADYQQLLRRMNYTHRGRKIQISKSPSMKAGSSKPRHAFKDDKYEKQRAGLYDESEGSTTTTGKSRRLSVCTLPSLTGRSALRGGTTGTEFSDARPAPKQFHKGDDWFRNPWQVSRPQDRLRRREERPSPTDYARK